METNKDTISIIIPTYNRAAALIQTINSILSQEFLDDVILEFVIIDDGSTDGTKDTAVVPLIKEINKDAFIKKKFKLVYLQIQDGPKGPSESRNTGIVHCNGNYVYFIDSDDLLYSNTALNTLYRYIKEKEKEKGPCLVYGDTIMYNNKGDDLWEVKHLFRFPYFNREVLARSEGMIPMGSFILSTEILRELPIFNEEITVGEDFEWQLRVSSSYKFFNCGEIILKYFRSDTGQLSTPPSLDQITKNTSLISSTKNKILCDDCSLSINEEEISNNILTTLDDLDIMENGNITSDGDSKILWILNETRFNRKFLNKIKDYKIILTFNPSLTEKIKSMVTSETYVNTLGIPFDIEQKYNPYSGEYLDKVTLIEESPILEEELDLMGIEYDILEDNNYLTSKAVILPNNKYFSLYDISKFVLEGKLIVTSGTLGMGIIPGGSIITCSKSYMDTFIKKIIEYTHMDIDKITYTAYHWFSNKSEYSVNEVEKCLNKILENVIEEVDYV